MDILREARLIEASMERLSSSLLRYSEDVDRLLAGHPLPSQGDVPLQPPHS